MKRTLILAAAGLLLAGLARAQEQPILRVGEELAGTVEAEGPVLANVGPGVELTLDPERDARVTLSLESHDFDACLRVEDTETRSLLGEDEDGGLRFNARLVLDLEAGRRYRVYALASRWAGGQFVLRAFEGEPQPLIGLELIAARIEFHRIGAERAEAQGKREALATHLFDCAWWHRASSRYAEALEYYARAAPIWLELRRHDEASNTYGALGDTCRHMGELALAREWYGRGRELAERIRDERLMLVFRADEGRILSAEGRHEEALEVYREVTLEFHRLGYAKELISNLGNAAAEARFLRRYDEALEFLQWATDVAEELGDPRELADVVSSRASHHHSLGEYELSIEQAVRAAEMFRALGSRDDEAQALLFCGASKRMLRRYAEAQEDFERALELSRGGAVLVQGQVLIELGRTARERNRPALARERFVEALELSRRDGVGVVHYQALEGLGQLASARGDRHRALDYFRHAFEVATDAEARVFALRYQLSMLELGVPAAAAEVVEVGEAVIEGFLAGSPKSVPWARRAIGVRLLELGEVEAAVDQFEKGLAYAGYARLPQFECEFLARLASCVLATDRGRAEVLAAGALQKLEHGFDSEALLVHRAHVELALAAGDLERAERHERAVRPVVEEMMQVGREGDLAASYRAETEVWNELGHDVLGLRIERAGGAGLEPGAIARGFERAGWWQARRLATGVSEHAAGGRSAEVLSLRDELDGARSRYYAELREVGVALRERLPSDEVAALRANAEARRTEVEQAEARLREASPRDGLFAVSAPATLDEVQAGLLGERTALISFADGARGLYAYVVTSDAAELVRLGERTAAEREIAQFTRAVADPASLGSPADVARLGGALYWRVLAPLVARIDARAQRLCIVPSAVFAGLPFDALVTGVRSAQPASFAELDFVIDRFELSYAPSPDVALLLRRTPPRAGAGRMLVVGDPFYEEGQGELATAAPTDVLRQPLSSLVFERLPETRGEALAIAELGRRARGLEPILELATRDGGRSVRHSGPAAELLLGDEARLERLLGDLRQYGVLHFAAHAVVEADNPSSSGIALSRRGGRQEFLTLDDISGLDLDADLVVLSACATAGGPMRAAEGVESLANACIYAGARNVVASLWSVSDSAACTTMERLYEGMLLEGLGPGAALRRAKLAVRAASGTWELRDTGGLRSQRAPVEAGHPFFWSPFVHVGP